MLGQTIARRTLVITIIVALVAAGGYYLVQANSGRNLGDVSQLGASGKAKPGNDGKECEPNGEYGEEPDCPKKVKICHRTASNKNPYRLITVNRNALQAHRDHPPKNGRRDIIPAPAQGCPDG